MNALEFLRTRASNGKLSEPGPDDAALALAFEAAARAPDHGALRPWRFHVVRGAARERLGTLLAALEREQPGASEEAVAKARLKPMRAPVLLVVSARVVPNPKVPAVEQVLSAGAAALLALLALQAQGYCGIWRTGAPVYSDTLKRAFGLRGEDAIVGILYLGTPKQAAPEQRRPAIADFVSEWTDAAD